MTHQSWCITARVALSYRCSTTFCATGVCRLAAPLLRCSWSAGPLPTPSQVSNRKQQGLRPPEQYPLASQGNGCGDWLQRTA